MSQETPQKPEKSGLSGLLMRMVANLAPEQMRAAIEQGQQSFCSFLLHWATSKMPASEYGRETVIIIHHSPEHVITYEAAQLVTDGPIVRVERGQQLPLPVAAQAYQQLSEQGK